MSVQLRGITLMVGKPTRAQLLADCRGMLTNYALWCRKYERAFDARLHWELSTLAWGMVGSWAVNARAGRLNLLGLPVVVYEGQQPMIELKTRYDAPPPELWKPCSN